MIRFKVPVYTSKLHCADYSKNKFRKTSDHLLEVCGLYSCLWNKVENLRSLYCYSTAFMLTYAFSLYQVLKFTNLQHISGKTFKIEMKWYNATGVLNYDLISHVCNCYFRGQSPVVAEAHFLENAKKLAMYGVDMHDVKVWYDILILWSSWEILASFVNWRHLPN